MSKQPPLSAKPKAPKVLTTKEAVQRVQRRTAIENGGQQADWTRRLQSTVDKQGK